ncbi:14559_t:CDS:2 [Entrophospora sp. SA101]|nr:14559_t:CDS:2 [Entrophospora sp. SA101]
MFFFLVTFRPQLTRRIVAPVRCPSCLDPNPTVYSYDFQHRLEAFFIPIWWFSKKEIWKCEKCNWAGDEKPDEQEIRKLEERDLMMQQRPPLPTWGLTTCPSCKMEINISGRIKFCPYCGNQVINNKQQQ